MSQPASTPVDWANLPRIESPYPPRDVVDRVRTGSKRGRMPGFRDLGAGEGGMVRFAAAIFGIWWDDDLVATVRPNGAGSKLELTRKRRVLIPAVILAVLVLSVWPGVLLMDTLVPSSWGWVGTHVWWWYVPLTALSNAWGWFWAMGKTGAAMQVSVAETIAAIAKEVDGMVGGMAGVVGGGPGQPS